MTTAKSDDRCVAVRAEPPGDADAPKTAPAPNALRRRVLRRLLRCAAAKGLD